MAEDFMPLLGLGSRRALGRQRKAGCVLLRARDGLHRGRRTPAPRRECATALPTCSSRETSASSSRARCARSTRSRRHHAKHGDGVRDIALTVPDATQAYREAVSRGARSVLEPRTDEDEFGKVERSAIATYGDTIHTFVNRADYAGPFLPGYVSTSANGHAGPGPRPPEHRPHRRQRRARPDGPLGRVLRDGLRDDEHPPLRRRPDPDRVLGADVEGHVGRRREDQVPDQRAGRGQAQEPDRGVRRVLRRRRGAAHRARARATSSAPSRR